MTSAPPSKFRVIGLILLIVTTILWGSTFIITKIITQNIPIFLYLGLRYSISLVGVIPFLINIRKINKSVILMGFLTGLIYFFAITFQTYGLQTTTAGKAGFITGLNTIIVPFMAWLWHKKPFEKRIWIAVILSIIGMAFLLLEGEAEIRILIGDLLVLVCAFFCALFIVLTDKFVKLVNVYLYTIIQLLTNTLLSFGSSLLFNESYELFSVEISFWFVMLYMGVGVTALTFIFENWSQKYVGPAQTAIIFTLEPVFAILFGIWIGNEILSLQGWIGCGLIFLAIIVTSIKNHDSKNL